ncbi:LOW QUALITY PROTEIN: hypothetical protein MAR_005058, partial [Mya arenaria]
MRRKKGQFISKSNANRASIINNVNVEKKTCISVPETVPPWLEGRRVVEIGVILERLSSCSSCGNSFCINGIGETIYGLGSILHISCNTCRMVNLVPTGKRHSTSDGSAARRCFDVNTKLAAGKFCHHINSQRCANKCTMINAGESQISAIIAELNLPGISKTALKAREREIGPSIEMKQKGLNIERLTMDGDSTTFTRVKRSLFPELKKSNDKNIVKNFGNELYKLKSKHKSLSNNNIAHIQKCFSYGISQNKGSTHGIKTSLDALPSHMFNEHSSCSPTWCTSLRDENYRQAHILQGTELRKDFQNVIH